MKTFLQGLSGFGICAAIFGLSLPPYGTWVDVVLLGALAWNCYNFLQVSK